MFHDMYKPVLLFVATPLSLLGSFLAFTTTCVLLNAGLDTQILAAAQITTGSLDLLLAFGLFRNYSEDLLTSPKTTVMPLDQRASL